MSRPDVDDLNIQPAVVAELFISDMCLSQGKSQEIRVPD